MYIRTLTREGCFYINRLQVESFPQLTENPILRRGLRDMICNVTNSPKVDSGPVKTTSAHTLRMDFAVK